jgi:hypothetical protein
MEKVANLPLTITNSNDETSVFELTIRNPEPKELKDGYQPIPEPIWITLEDNEITLPAQGIYKGDVTITIPDDPKLLGKKYQVILRARQKGAETGLSVSLALEGRLLLSIAPEITLQSGDPIGAVNLAFELLPERVSISPITLGQKVPVLTAEKQPMQIKNLGKKSAVYKFSSIDLKATGISLEPGYEAASDPAFLTFPKPEVKVKPGATQPVEMILEIPDQPEYRGKKFEFLGVVELGSKVTGMRYFRILAETNP